MTLSQPGQRSAVVQAALRILPRKEMVQSRADEVVGRVGAGLTLALPLFLLHGRGLAEGIVGVLAALFVGRSAVGQDWAWLRRTWVRIGLGWWLWLVLCSAVAHGNVVQALGVVRFLLLGAALEHWLLNAEWVRRWLVRLLRLVALYMAAQCALQFATGRNLFGWPRGADGELTGPYRNPRAGAPLSRLLFPALLPLARGPAAALPLLGGGVLVMILIGQRAPVLLTFLGLLVTALLLPRLRMPVLLAALMSGLLLAALPVVSPEAAHRLEQKFTAQMLTFPESHYGQIAARAFAIARAHPVFGAGFDGFRRLCDDPRYFAGWGGGDGGGAAMCVQHPHNFYMQALVESGAPGLALFTALACAWLLACGRGLIRHPDPLRVGLFVGVLVHLWPIASSNDLISMPLAGWFSLLLGLALAHARAYMPANPQLPQT